MSHTHPLNIEGLLTTDHFEITLRDNLQYVIDQVKSMVETSGEHPPVNNFALQPSEQDPIPSGNSEGQQGADHDAREPSQVVDDLRSQVQDLSKQVGMLNLRFDWSSTKGTMISKEDCELRHLLSAEKEKNRKLAQINNGLRNALIKPTQHIPDGDIENQFMKLGSSIRGYVQSTFENEWDRSIDGLSVHNETFFLPFRNKDRSMRYLPNRVRGKIFAIIWGKILSRSYYTGKFGRELEGLEEGLLEHLPNANLKDFVDWRSASIRCSRALTNESDVGQNGNISKDTPSAAPSFLVNCSNYIHNFFLPLKRKKGTSAEKQYDQLYKVCLEAHHLVELMHSARDVFQVKFDCKYQAEDVFDLVEVENSEKTASRKESGKIAFWTSGALTKRTEENPEIVTIVAKGSVFTYKFI
ncbi:hypothetical protein F4782DRAFT_532725 [Xylaria castorea]|nr:hypothetical protein F4782DRAFT_532725 [Xylaria castorea]